MGAPTLTSSRRIAAHRNRRMARKIYSAYSAALPLMRHELLPIPEVWIHQEPTENNLDYERARVTLLSGTNLQVSVA